MIPLHAHERSSNILRLISLMWPRCLRSLRHQRSHLDTSRIFAIRVSASVRTRNSTRRDRAGSSTPLASNTGCDEDSPLAVKYCLSQPRSPLTSGRLSAKSRADRVRACESSIFRKYASSGVVTLVQSDDVCPSMRTSLMAPRVLRRRENANVPRKKVAQDRSEFRLQIATPLGEKHVRLGKADRKIVLD